MRQAAGPANLFINTWLSTTLASSINRNCSQRWECATSEDIKNICFNLWTQFQEEFENSFEQKQHHWRKCTSPPRWCFEGEEVTGLCKFNSFFSPFFFFNVTYGLQVPDQLPHERIKPGMAKSNPFPVQADSISTWSSQGGVGNHRERPVPVPPKHSHSTVFKTLWWAMSLSQARRGHSLPVYLHWNHPQSSGSDEPPLPAPVLNHVIQSL